VAYKIVWSEFAERQLDEIYAYYSASVSLQIASNIVLRILNDIDILCNHPKLGQIEKLLTNRKTTYRYLVSTNYKIIYNVDQGLKQIKIADVFDARQNPEKIKRNK